MESKTIFCFLAFAVFVVCAEQSLQDDQVNAAQFLTRFGYLSLSRSGNHDTKKAIRQYQRFFHLKETGDLDEATQLEMAKPRCGNPDVQIISNKIGRAGGYGGKWRKTHLTYRFINTGRDLNPQTTKEILKRAFAMWSAVTPLTFQESRHENSDFTILFDYGSHGDNSPFDNAGGVLAHAYFPENGRVHFDEAETWVDKNGRGVDLLWVAVHEIGHAIGLEHSNVRGAIMYPTYQGAKHPLNLHSDDKQRIQRLYGNGGNGGSNCVDRDRRCPGWTRYCRNNRYVKTNCRKTCRLC